MIGTREDRRDTLGSASRIPSIRPTDNIVLTTTGGLQVLSHCARPLAFVLPSPLDSQSEAVGWSTFNRFVRHRAAKRRGSQCTASERRKRFGSALSDRIEWQKPIMRSIRPK